MNSNKVFSGFVLMFFAILLFFVSELVLAQKYRLCVVDGKGAFKKVFRLCPKLDLQNSLVECIVGIDRLDCLQKVHKGTADFGVFYPEDLIIALNFNYDILITAELRYTKNDAEYDVVIVSNRNHDVDNIYEIHGANLCHPGFGNEPHWSRILANVLEEKIVPKLCDPSLTMIENRIKASSEFFGKACKAGPWIHTKDFDRLLKNKYRNLCNLCYDHDRCSVHDKYWGRTGALYCLTDGLGDISLARLDDVNLHFGIKSMYKIANPLEYQFLCPDGTKRDLNDSCIWASKPWPVIASKSDKANEIQQVLRNISPNDVSEWGISLLSLLKIYNSDLHFESYLITLEKYLTEKQGFLSAYSFTGCYPNHAVRLCTISNLEHQKCQLLKEVAQVQGLEPSVECVKLKDKYTCMKMVQLQHIDLVFIEPDELKDAKTIYNLKSIFYESSPISQQYVTTIYVKKTSKIATIHDLLQSKQICVAKLNGIADISLRTLSPNLKTCSYDDVSSECYQNAQYYGELGSLKCLLDDKGDAVILNSNYLISLTEGSQKEIWLRNLKINENLRKICAFGINESCSLSWSYPGLAMVSDKTTEQKIYEILNIFFELDQLFGRNFTEIIPTFQMFNVYHSKKDVLFHSSTLKFVTGDTFNETYHYEHRLDNFLQSSSHYLYDLNHIYILIFIIFHYLN